MQLSKQKSREEIESRVNIKNIIKAKKSDFSSTELDIRGLNIEEAMIEIDKFLDNLYIQGVTDARIIHGKGTGQLRKGVNDYLKKHKLIKSKKFADFNAGGDGVTEIKLK